MKHNLIALAVAAACITPMAANAAPKVYGKLNLSVESYKKDPQAGTEEKYTRLQSNASRFGAKGEDELTADLSAVYQIEWEVAGEGDDITKGTNASLDLTQRNRFVGIKSQQFGTVKLGKYDSYTKLAQGEIDLFNDYLGDMKYTVAGENRLDNVVGYESPKIMDALTINVMAQTQDKSAGPKNGSSASVVYNNEEMGVYAALAIDNNIYGAIALSSTKRQNDNIRLVGSYKIQDLTVNALYQTSKAYGVAVGADKNLSSKETSWQLGAAYKIADETLKVQFGEAKADDNAAPVQSHTILCRC